MKHLVILMTLSLSSLVSLAQTQMIINKSDGNTISINVSSIKNISFASNLIRNGDFNNSFDNWIFVGDTINYYHPEDPGRADFTIKDGVAEVKIKNEGNTIWSVILYQKVNFEKATYVISFDAKADAPCEIISNVTQDGGSWTIYSGDRKFNLTNTMATYTYEFNMSTNSVALFQFCLGKIGTGKFYFDNVIVRKK